MRKNLALMLTLAAVAALAAAAIAGAASTKIRAGNLVLTFGGSASMQIRRVVSTPSSFGMRTSMSTTSTAVDRSASSASTPSPASATTSMSGWAASTIRNPVRSSTWSSTSITRIVIGASSVRFVVGPSQGL